MNLASPPTQLKSLVVLPCRKVSLLLGCFKSLVYCVMPGVDSLLYAGAGKGTRKIPLRIPSSSLIVSLPLPVGLADENDEIKLFWIQVVSLAVWPPPRHSSIINTGYHSTGRLKIVRRQ